MEKAQQIEPLKPYEALKQTNEFLAIMGDKTVPMIDRLTAVYVRALEKDCFDHYRPLQFPPVPSGWLEAHNAYQSIAEDKGDNKKKSDAWKVMLEKFSGYLKLRDQRKAENDSNLKFLTEMLEHFEKVGLTAHAEKVRNRLRHFESILVAA